MTEHARHRFRQRLRKLGTTGIDKVDPVTAVQHGIGVFIISQMNGALGPQPGPPGR